MKSKRLTIIFFSMVMLAVSPRVLSHLNTYADALHQKAEAEWLNLLLGFASPAETEINKTATGNSQHSFVCSKDADVDKLIANDRSNRASKPRSRSMVSNKKTFEYAVADLRAASHDIQKTSLQDGVLIDRRARWQTVPTPLSPGAPVAVNSDIRAKAEYLWTLSQSTRSGDRKAARLLVKELITLVNEKKWSNLIVPARFESDINPPAKQKVIADQGTNERDSSTDDSMH